MNSHAKLGLIVFFFIVILIGISHFLSKTSQTYTFDFSKTLGIEFSGSELAKVVKDAIKTSGLEDNGTYAIYVEDLVNGDKYGVNESISFLAASLYKLIVMAAVLKEVEAGDLTLEESISSTKTHLNEVLGGLDFGYEEAPENISYTVDEALTRVGSISDNFAAIMLTEKLRKLRVARSDDNKLLIQMTKDLGMDGTSFDEIPTTNTLDIATFFKQLYNGQVVSKTVSDKIIGYLSVSKLNNRIPAKLPESVKVVHKTGELARLRHDAGIIFPDPNTPNHPYILVLLTKDLQYEDSGVESLAQISKDVFDYFNKP